MKKTLFWGIPAAIALLLVFVGPDLLDLYRLQRYLTTSAETYQAEKGAWPHLTDTCTGCHGAQGSSVHQAYPSLAGQPAPYLATQLRKFASGERHDPNMSPLAMTLSEDEINLLSNYYAKQPAVKNRFFKADPELREKGKQLVAAAGCAACHGDRLMGHELNPRLAGQGYDYLLAQLDAYAAGTRRDPTGMMNNLAAASSPQERKAMAHYIASHSPGDK